MWASRAELNAKLLVFVNANNGRILFDTISKHQYVQSAKRRRECDHLILDQVAK